MKAKNATELIKLLNEYRAFINVLFDSAGHQMHIGSATGIIGYESLSLLEDYSIVETFNNEVLLDDKIASMLEAHLIDGYSEDVLDYIKIFKTINDNIDLYYKAFENQSDGSRYLREIQRRLKKIPNNIRDNLISIQRHVDFAYRSATSPAQKVQELVIHNESLREIEERIIYIRAEMAKLKGFVNSTGDPSIQFYQNRLNTYLQDASNTLIQTNSTVVEYIRKTNENIRFHKHLVELAELAQKREITDKTNIYELVAKPDRWLYHSGYVNVERMNWQIKLKLDFDDGELERLLTRCAKPIKDIGKAVPSSEAIDISEEVEEEVISSDFLLDEYFLAETDAPLYDYFHSKIGDVDEAMMLELYLSAMVIGEQLLYFPEDVTVRIGEYQCLSAYKSTIKGP